MTVTRETPWRTTGDTDCASFAAELAGSPVAPFADELCDAASPYGRLYLAHSKAENRHDTVGILIDPGMFNNLALRPRGYPEEVGTRNGFAVFPSYVACLAAWRRRLTDASIDTGKVPKNYVEAATLLEYCEVYNPSGDTHPVTGVPNRSEVYCDRLCATINRLPLATGETPMPDKPKVLVTRGHGTTGDAGAPGEEAQNRKIAPAIASALRAAGYDVTTFPANLDGEAPGTLDTEAKFAHDWMARTPGTKVMVDCHLEWSSSRGIFAIVANDKGLATGAPVAQPPGDVWENNAGDRALGKAICEEVHNRTGIPIRASWVREPGLMSEEMTWVGQGGGGAYPPSRLAMFGWTAPHHESTYRLVVEFANLTLDQDYYQRADFPAHCAGGVVAAMNRVFGQPQQPPPPEPEPEPQPPAFVALDPPWALLKPAGPWDGTDRTLNQTLCWAVRREWTARRQTRVYRYADPESGEVRAPLGVGERFQSEYWMEVGGEPWVISSTGARIPVSGCTPALEFKIG